MKEAMSADIGYLRKLNLQLVEQHMKGIVRQQCGVVPLVAVVCLVEFTLVLVCDCQPFVLSTHFEAMHATTS
jgi:hypothetical protein